MFKKGMKKKIKKTETEGDGFDLNFYPLFFSTFSGGFYYHYFLLFPISFSSCFLSPLLFINIFCHCYHFSLKYYSFIPCLSYIFSLYILYFLLIYIYTIL